MEPKTAPEIERRFIIAKPDTADLAAQKDFTQSEITQIYLSAPTGVTRRVRRRAYADGRTVCTETEKRRVDRMSAIETEREIDEATFDRLAADRLDGTRPITKMRYTFSTGRQTAEIDLFPEWARTAILEIELPTEDTPPQIPPFLRVLREVTGDRTYSNAAFSRVFPPEEDF